MPFKRLPVGRMLPVAVVMLLLVRIPFAAAFDPQLPVVLLPAASDTSRPLVLFISGDGGWKDFSPRLAARFVAQRCPVVALNALRYFWNKKTPAETTAAVAGLLERYLAAWNRRSFILVGFSFGADVAPFVLNRLPAALAARCAGIALFSPGTSTDFEIHLSQMMGTGHRWPYDVVAEISRRRPVPMLCVFGSREHGFPIDSLRGPELQVAYLAGGHHYEEDHRDLGAMVLEKLGIG